MLTNTFALIFRSSNPSLFHILKLKITNFHPFIWIQTSQKKRWRPGKEQIHATVCIHGFIVYTLCIYITSLRCFTDKIAPRPVSEYSAMTKSLTCPKVRLKMQNAYVYFDFASVLPVPIHVLVLNMSKVFKK